MRAATKHQTIIMFDTAFFGYSDLPDYIELEGKSYVPLKAIRVKYHGTRSKVTPFDVENLKALCKFLRIDIYRPVKGLYCIEQLHAKFFDVLHKFYEQKRSEVERGDLCWGWGVKYYNYRGDLMSRGSYCGMNPFHKVIVDSNSIRNLYDNFLMCATS